MSNSKIMYDLIEAFPKHLKEAVDIGRSADLKKSEKTFTNVVITGLGGSGIGGRIAGQMVAQEATCPIEVYSNYYLPAYVGSDSLVIASSYSGNTEETLAAMNEAIDRGATVACITSGGKMLEIAKDNGLDHIIIPGGNPPRTMLAYSLTQQFILLNHFGIAKTDVTDQLVGASEMLVRDHAAIQSLAQEITATIKGKRVVIYSEASTEAVCVRFRQQLNENSKELCWHHAIPEMNHNELVGWAGGSKDIAVVLFRHESDHERSQIRMGINKKIFAKYTDTTVEVWSKGDNQVERQFYLINLGDWVSWYLADANGVDPIEIEVIDMLKGELAKV
jgi:glucose/mannose-6-phosphate isomerase